MKPILIAVALFAGTFTKSFATDRPTIDRNVLKSFQSTFANATEISWSLSQDLYKAVFFLNGQYVTAYYDTDGNMQALARHISAASLPMLLQTELKNECKNQWITDVLEVTTNGSVQYYATLEDAGSRVILRSASTTWSTFQKQRKE